MPRILGIDYGLKRVGIAVSDPLQLIATSLETVATPQIFDYLGRYFRDEEVETIVIGEPFNTNGTPSEIHPAVMQFADEVRRRWPQLQVAFLDERFTSRDAQRYILESGIGKMKRRDKSLVDKMSASIILRSYMDKVQR